MKINLKFLKFLPTFFFVSLLLLFLIEIFWPKNFLEKAETGAASWPQSAKSHLLFSQALFKTGYQDLAEKEYRIAHKSLKITTSEDLFQETEDIINKPEKTKKQIEAWEITLAEKPWYRDVFLNLALLYDKQYLEEKSREYFQKAFYLDPLGQKVQQIGKALGFL